MNSVIKGASYILVHTPDMVLYNGTTQTTERIVNPESEYLKEVPEKLRSYEEAVSYRTLWRNFEGNGAHRSRRCWMNALMPLAFSI